MWQNVSAEIVAQIFMHLSKSELIPLLSVSSNWRYHALRHLNDISLLSDEVRTSIHKGEESLFYYYYYYYNNYLVPELKALAACRFANVKMLTKYIKPYDQDDTSRCGCMGRRTGVRHALRFNLPAGMSGSVNFYLYVKDRYDINYNYYFTGACQGNHRNLAILLISHVSYYQIGISTAINYGNYLLAQEILQILALTLKSKNELAEIFERAFFSVCHQPRHQRIHNQSVVKAFVDYLTTDSQWFDFLNSYLQQECIYSLLSVKVFDDYWIMVFNKLLPLVKLKDMPLLAAAKTGNVIIIEQLWDVEKQNNLVLKNVLLDLTFQSGNIEAVRFIAQYFEVLTIDYSRMNRYVITPEIYHFLRLRGLGGPIVQEACVNYLVLNFKIITPNNVELLLSLGCDYSLHIKSLLYTPVSKSDEFWQYMMIKKFIAKIHQIESLTYTLYTVIRQLLPIPIYTMVMNRVLEVDPSYIEKNIDRLVCVILTEGNMKILNLLPLTMNIEKIKNRQDIDKYSYHYLTTLI